MRGGGGRNPHWMTSKKTSLQVVRGEKNEIISNVGHAQEKKEKAGSTFWKGNVNKKRLKGEKKEEKYFLSYPRSAWKRKKDTAFSH